MYPALSQAEHPGIEIKLEWETSQKLEYTDYSKPILVLVKVSNKNSAPVLIERGFTNRDFHRAIKIVDPSGRLLIPKRTDSEGRPAPSVKLPHLSPLPYLLPNNDPTAVPIRVIPCEELPLTYVNSDPKKDLKKYFHSGFPELPGYYSAQAQVSTIIFNGGTCDVDHRRWTGVIKSNIVSFYASGRTKIKVTPDKWRLSWASMASPPKVYFQLFCQNGKKSSDYDLKKIYLNHRTRVEVEKEGPKEIVSKPPPQGDACIKSIGKVTTPGVYWITLTGRFKSGRLFGGSQKITIIK
ncbi:MAG: hypothetical protein U9Q05_04080 [Thermodesulfobacteriota bacterium]|nr:hypothetical protein [Thermodesulfobacteriota bacterium]